MSARDPRNQKDLRKHKKRSGHSSDEGGYSSDESESGDDNNEYENDGFVVDDDDDDEDSFRGDDSEYNDRSDGSDGDSRKGGRRKQPKQRLKRIKRLDSNDEEAGELPKRETNGDPEDEGQPRAAAGRLKRLRADRHADGSDPDNDHPHGEADPQDDDDLANEDEDEEEYDEDNFMYPVQKDSILRRVFDEENIEREERQIQQRMDEERLRNANIKNLYEPADLIQNYMTPGDKLIAQTDIPERLQLLYRHRDEPTQEELEEESRWLAKQLSLHRGLSEREEEGLDKRLLTILRMLRLSHFEVMYIWTYQQKEFSLDFRRFPDHYALKLSDLWYVFEMDQEWRNVWAKKDIANKLIDYMQEHMHIPEQVEAFRRDAASSRHLDWLIEWAEYQSRKVYTFEELSNWFVLMNIKSPVSSLSGSKTISYEMTQRGLTHLAESFTLTADQLAYNLVGNNRHHRLPVLQEKPLDLSRRAIRPDFPQFKEGSQVFHEMLSYLAQEYFTHPVIKMELFKEMKGIVTINSEPTERGKSLTIYDYFYPAKRVSHKRIDADIHSLWLLLLEAEKKGLIKIVFKYEGGTKDIDKYNVRQKLAMHLLSQPDPTATHEQQVVAQQWNKVRDSIISKVVEKYLTPEFEKALQQDLTENAERYVFGQCMDALRTLINTKPYRVRDTSLPPTEPASVLACANDDTTAIFVVLRQNGDVQGFLELRNVLRRPLESNLTQYNLFHQDLQRLRDFVDKHKPDVIVVAPKNLKSHNLKMELFTIADNVAKASEQRVPFVMWGNFQISPAFAKSQLSELLLPGYSPLLKEAISTARFIQNPLAETLNLWSDNDKANGLLQLSLHEFQHLVNPYKLMSRLENMLVELVNKVGVDLSSCLLSKHLSKQLHFVCGLGPRKATKLADELRGVYEQLEAEWNDQPSGLSRAYINQHQLLGSVVMVNAIGFLQLCRRRDFQVEGGVKAEERERFEWLDFTRIHPDDYTMAIKICTSVVDKTQGQDNLNVLAVLEKPSQLDGYNLEEYGQHLSATTGSNMIPLIDFIVRELKEPFRDDRSDFQTRNDNRDLFYRLSGESKHSFVEGAFVTARIISVGERSLKAVTGSDLITIARFGDNSADPGSDPSAAYIVGNFIRAKIYRINYGELSVDLSLRPRDLAAHSDFLRNSRPLERFFVSDGHGFRVNRDEDFPRNALEARTPGKAFQFRKVCHPFFKNAGLEKAQELLSERARGEFLFRPSSKGLSFINITWRLFDDMYVHLIIKEGPKLPNEEVSRKLELNKKEYDSLDSIISNYLRPCNKIVDGILVHEKFNPDGVEAVRSLLLELKAAKPALIPYLFTTAKEYPCFLVLCYAINRDAIKYELVQIKPAGLGFHQQIFANLDFVIRFFKDNVKKKEYVKYVETLPPVDFGMRGYAKKEEAKAEPYVKEEARRRSPRDYPVKREYGADPRVKQEYAEPYGRPRDYQGGMLGRRPVPSYGGAPARRKGSDDSLEYDKRSPARGVKREADSGVKIEHDATLDPARAAPKRRDINFEAA